jgi:ADP-ribose pyrophosphatase YjhB (NUDIX family)
MNVAAFATAVNDDGEILLIRRTDLNVWEAPGGRAAKDESPWDAVVRETQEESGVIVTVKQLAGVYWRPTKPALVFQFLCNVTGGKAASSEEAAEVRFFPLDALPDRIAPVVRERIADSVNSPGVFRTQQGPGAREFIASLR